VKRQDAVTSGRCSARREGFVLTWRRGARP